MYGKVWEPSPKGMQIGDRLNLFSLFLNVLENDFVFPFKDMNLRTVDVLFGSFRFFLYKRTPSYSKIRKKGKILGRIL
ncbi:hypothetical protein SAMN05877753_10393 [Bacillus oleivorans]|uniref:Uncharacterized protein n=1 Tax=Bacillus oleivorans TaxID=1448271 RepID=A0A285CR22_9BACI|nr:hypothetical protein SAMN05877753_10393 [Bacillus oleivorans]